MPITADLGEAKEQFFTAIAEGDVPKVKDILTSHPGAIRWEHGLDDGRHFVPRTFPLHAAAVFGQRDVAAALLDAKADINALKAERTALMVGAELGRTGIVTLLLDRDADPALDVPEMMPNMARFIAEHVEKLKKQRRQAEAVGRISENFSKGAGRFIAAPERATFGRKNTASGLKLS